MNYMVCTTCRGTVQENNIGICLACQQGFKGIPQEDGYKKKKLIDQLKEREKELEDALEKRKKNIECAKISKKKGKNGTKKRNIQLRDKES